MRFRKSIKIASGLKIHLSKSGVSTTIGGKGLSANIGGKGVYLNTGIPGTGISARHKIAGGGRAKSGRGSVDYRYKPVKTTLKNAKAIPGAKIKRNILLFIALILFIAMVAFFVQFSIVSIGRGFLCGLGSVFFLVFGLAVSGNIDAAEKKFLSNEPGYRRSPSDGGGQGQKC
jgi:hypothetical protein